LGVYFNLSIWYKLNNKTMYGAVFMIIGALITIVGNIVFVPIYGIAAAAYCHLVVYSVLVLLSYTIGQSNYKVPYDMRKLLIYILLPVLITVGFAWVKPSHIYIRLVIGNAILLTFVTFALWNEGILKEVKLISKRW
jgi:O-antigen/teichoic acid export membrane protein